MVCDDNFEWPYCIQYSQLCCIEMTKSVIKTYSKKKWFLLKEEVFTIYVESILKKNVQYTHTNNFFGYVIRIYLMQI